MTDSIVILDFGSQYSQLIARRVREAHVYCELFPWDAPAEKVLALQPKGFILSGGPNFGLRARRAAASALRAGNRPAGVGNLLRHAGPDLRPGWQSGGISAARIWPRHASKPPATTPYYPPAATRSG